MWWNTPVVNHLDLLKLISVEQDKQFHRTSLIEALLYARTARFIAQASQLDTSSRRESRPSYDQFRRPPIHEELGVQETLRYIFI